MKIRVQVLVKDTRAVLGASYDVTKTNADAVRTAPRDRQCYSYGSHVLILGFASQATRVRSVARQGNVTRLLLVRYKHYTDRLRRFRCEHEIFPGCCSCFDISPCLLVFLYCPSIHIHLASPAQLLSHLVSKCQSNDQPRSIFASDNYGESNESASFGGKSGEAQPGGGDGSRRIVFI